MRIVEGRATIEDVDAFLDRLAAIGEERGCAVQAFDARLIAGRDHLAGAVERANRAFERGENVARDRAVEILLYAAGRRQIDRALEMGLDEGAAAVVVVIDGDDEDAAVAGVETTLSPAALLGLDGEADADAIRRFFDVSDAELAAAGTGLEPLVCERVALLDVEK